MTLPKEDMEILGMRKRGDFDFFTLLMYAVPIGLALWALIVLWLMFG